MEYGSRVLTFDCCAHALRELPYVGMITGKGFLWNLRYTIDIDCDFIMHIVELE